MKRVLMFSVTVLFLLQGCAGGIKQEDIPGIIGGAGIGAVLGAAACYAGRVNDFGRCLASGATLGAIAGGVNAQGQRAERDRISAQQEEYRRTQQGSTKCHTTRHVKNGEISFEEICEAGVERPGYGSW